MDDIDNIQTTECVCIECKKYAQCISIKRGKVWNVRLCPCYEGFYA